MAMSDIVSADPTEFHTEADFAMVHKLLQNALYKIPPEYREAVLGSAATILTDVEIPAMTRLAASRVIIECDKINLDLVKLAMPKKVITRSVTDMTSDELKKVILEAAAHLQSALPILDVPQGEPEFHG